MLRVKIIRPLRLRINYVPLPPAPLLQVHPQLASCSCSEQRPPIHKPYFPHPCDNHDTNFLLKKKNCLIYHSFTGHDQLTKPALGDNMVSSGLRLLTTSSLVMSYPKDENSSFISFSIAPAISFRTRLQQNRNESPRAHEQCDHRNPLQGPKSHMKKAEKSSLGPKVF